MAAKIDHTGQDGMNAGATQARQWAHDLVRQEARGPGDLENAMRRLEGRYGIAWRTFWTLRYRPPPDVMHGVWERLRQAWLAEKQRQMRKIEHEVAITKAIAGDAHPFVDAAEAVVGARRRTGKKTKVTA